MKFNVYVDHKDNYLLACQVESYRGSFRSVLLVSSCCRFTSKSYHRPFRSLMCSCGRFSSKSHRRPFRSLLLLSSCGRFSSTSYRRRFRSLFLRSRLRPFLKQELLQAIRMFVIVCVWPFLEQELLQAIWIFVAHEFVGSFLKHELP